jgi:hypothetical protein
MTTLSRTPKIPKGLRRRLEADKPDRVVSRLLVEEFHCNLGDFRCRNLVNDTLKIVDDPTLSSEVRCHSGYSVIPAKAGIHPQHCGGRRVDSRLRGNDSKMQCFMVPAELQGCNCPIRTAKPLLVLIRRQFA